MRWNLIWPLFLSVLAQTRFADSLKDAELESGLLSEAESHFSYMQRIRRSASLQIDKLKNSDAEVYPSIWNVVSAI